MAASLPAMPRLVFTVIEPISLLCGWIPTLISPQWFIEEQIPLTPSGAIGESAVLVAYQLGNCYLLLALVGLSVLLVTSEIKVVKSYLFALWLADISHVALTLFVLWQHRVLEVSSWNAMTWGNVGFTVCLYPPNSIPPRVKGANVTPETFLWLMRTAYFLGAFGRDIDPKIASKKNT